MGSATVVIKRMIRHAFDRWIVPSLQRTGLLRFGRAVAHRRVLTVAMFHRVLPLGSDACRHAEREYVVGTDEFARCLEFFDRHYTVVSLAQVERAAGGLEKLPAYPLLITFDDGWHDNVRYAEPLLKRHRMKATMFVNVDAVRQPGARWWQDALVEAAQRPLPGSAAPDFFTTMAATLARPLGERTMAVLPAPQWRPAARQMLTAAEIGAIDDEVWDIGSHGVTHAPLTLAPDPAAELEESARCLSNWHRAPIRSISMPHGRHSAEILRLARSIYSLVFTSDPVVTRARADRLQGPIGRIHVPSEACADERSLARFFWIRSHA